MSSPIRILHFADLHVDMERHGRIDPATGLNSRVMDFLRRLSDLTAYAIPKDVDMIILLPATKCTLGDLAELCSSEASLDY